ncbi:serine-rich adhesin for platelets [Coregonus clupeaformis]|uniref:serine-rich adhesin for platelets n=1 Tax=Coregonus clupeaformis TaxID=59861 RepID=UPI001BDF8019|nr:serine-rich adhesin for platelets [Coregonus clupeaformis]XP_041725602.1 serine-rich adhesin for platelets [Coregonus clupeaformis]XP_041725603.1 serine-rich adhesin for platelets [Coregonus clupeaformis]
MASTASFKGTGLLLFLLLGLQPSSFVSGQIINSSSFSTTDAATTVAATATVMSTEMSTVSAATMMAAPTAQDAANKATSTSNSSNIGSMTTAMTSTSSSVTIDNSGNTMAGSGTTSTDNTTSWGTIGMTMISCRQFSCNYSDCYSVYMNITAFSCGANITFCELRRQENMTYTGGCIASCSNACVNDTQTNCTMGCCNSTGCLSSTLASMDLTNTTTVTTVMMTTNTTEAAATTTTAEPTNKLKKCQMFQCMEQNCYKTWITEDPMPCPLNQPYCELKKMTTGSITMWMGGCNADCTRNTWCTTTADTCHQECCNTSMTSCLKLDGTLNVPSSATRDPHFPLALVTAALLACLLSIGSLV